MTQLHEIYMRFQESSPYIQTCTYIHTCKSVYVNYLALNNCIIFKIWMSLMDSPRYICIYICACTYKCVYIYTYIRLYIYICIYIYIYTRQVSFLWVLLYAYIFTFVALYVLKVPGPGTFICSSTRNLWLSNIETSCSHNLLFRK